MSKLLALIIDDEPDIRELLDITLKRMDVDSKCAEDLKSAKELLKKHSFNICLTDMRLPDGDGVEFVAYAQKHYSQMPIAVITAHGNMESAILALKSGAFDFLTKPVDLGLLRTLVKSALQLSKKSFKAKQQLVGDSKIMRDVRASITKLARSQAPIYISGETGTGKELAARMIHEYGPRAGKLFVPVNCGAIPQELMESEFFGHIKGSFTGAISNKEGLFQAAGGGTLFLDEIAELPPNMQVKLLRAVQEKTIRPIGSSKEIPVDVRILSATNTNLDELIEKGKFRRDLFYRINVIELYIPALRERTDDIPELVSYILERLTAGSDISEINLSNDAMQKLASYHFPGNIRELENILERAMILCDGNTIQIEDLKFSDIKNDHNNSTEQQAELDSYLGDIEKQKILQALEKTRWNKTAAAKLLGISFRALRYRLEKLGLN
jgi:two-component system response regulator PilR (NtrC family)